MTTGNYIRDNRTPRGVVSGGDFIYIYVGSVLRKNWVGADYAGTSPAISRRPFSLSQEPADPVNAVAFPAKIRGKTGRIPRSYYREEHEYSMSGSELVHSHCVYTSFGSPRQSASVSVGGDNASGWPALDWDGNDQNALISKLREKLAGSSFHLGVTLGEGKMALNMIAQSATRVHSALRALKRGNISAMYKALGSSRQATRYNRFREQGYLHYDDFLARENRRAIRESRQQRFDSDLSSLWLEAQYGWKPLLQDIHGAAAYIAERLENPDVQTVRVRSRKQLKDFYIESTNSTQVRLLKPEVQVSRQVIARIKSVNQASLAGMTDPLSVAWELTPWSFVVDWFLPVGDFINAATFGSAIDASYVVSTRKTQSWTGIAAVPGGGLVFSQGNLEARFKGTTLRREIMSSLPAALPKVKSLSESFSWMRAANATALLSQIRTGKSPSINQG